MWQILGWALGWFVRDVVVKFLVFSGLYALLLLLVPLAVSFLGGFISSSSLNDIFSAIPAGVWFFLDLFRIDLALPLVISAYVARFLIRRLPVIG
ncbi:MAG: DUF2523 domain-containing protein [Betaproteobacteria bacterium]|nr:DUF2523 domain-containing protein [Betaproteobacteria bacterium]